MKLDNHTSKLVTSLWSILFFSTILLIITPTTASEGGECHECREREKMCRPDIDWRDNWIAKEVPVPGIEVKTQIVERTVPINEVKIDVLELKKPVEVPKQEINVEYEWIDRDKIVEIPDFEIQERFIDQFVDVPEISEKVEKVPRKIVLPKKVVRIVPVKVTVDRQEGRPRFQKREKKVVKTVGVPEVRISAEKLNKTVMVHETTYKFCRVGENSLTPSCGSGGGNLPRPCSPCKKCDSCGKPGYSYKAPGANVPRLDDPSSGGGGAESDAWKSEEDAYYE